MQRRDGREVSEGRERAGREGGGRRTDGVREDVRMGEETRAEVWQLLERTGHRLSSGGGHDSTCRLIPAGSTCRAAMLFWHTRTQTHARADTHTGAQTNKQISSLLSHPRDAIGIHTSSHPKKKKMPRSWPAPEQATAAAAD